MGLQRLNRAIDGFYDFFELTDTVSNGRSLTFQGIYGVKLRRVNQLADFCQAIFALNEFIYVD